MENLSFEVQSMEKRIQLPDGFLNRLMSDDDWTFVIKSHALLETICSELLVQILGNPSLAKVVYRMELSNKYVGKIAFIESLDILDKKERGFISTLSSSRNELVHDVKKTIFSFHEYINGLDSNQKNNFIEGLGFAFYSDESGKVEGKDRDFILREPQKAIWLSLQNIVAIINMQIDIIVNKRQAVEHRLENLDHILEATEYRGQVAELREHVYSIKNLIDRT